MLTCSCGTKFGFSSSRRPKLTGDEIAGPEIGIGLIELFGYGTLKLTIDEGVEILADRLIVVTANNQIRAAGARIQTGIECTAPVRRARCRTPLGSRPTSAPLWVFWPP